MDGLDDTHVEEEKQDEANVVPTLPTLNVIPPFYVTVAPDPEPKEKTTGMNEEEERQTEGNVAATHN
jgi:hypothetical protein